MILQWYLFTLKQCSSNDVLSRLYNIFSLILSNLYLCDDNLMSCLWFIINKIYIYPYILVRLSVFVLSLCIFVFIYAPGLLSSCMFESYHLVESQFLQHTPVMNMRTFNLIQHVLCDLNNKIRS